MKKLDDSDTQINKGFNLYGTKEIIIENEKMFDNKIETRMSKHITNQEVSINLWNVLTLYKDSTIINFVDHCINLTPHTIKYVKNKNFIFSLKKRSDFLWKTTRKPVKDEIISESPVTICKPTSYKPVKVKNLDLLLGIIDRNDYTILISSTLTYKHVIDNLKDDIKKKIIILSPNTGSSCKRDTKGNIEYISKFILRYGDIELLNKE